MRPFLFYVDGFKLHCDIMPINAYDIPEQLS